MLYKLNIPKPPKGKAQVWIIAANVLQDKAFRTGAKVSLLHIDGDGGECPLVVGLSKGGRTITKRIAAKRLHNFRPKFVFYADTNIRFSLPDKATAAVVASRFEARWSKVRFRDHRTGKLIKGVSVNEAFKLEGSRMTIDKDKLAENSKRMNKLAENSKRMNKLLAEVADVRARLGVLLKKVYLAGATDTLEAQALERCPREGLMPIEDLPAMAGYDPPKDEWKKEAYDEGFRAQLADWPRSMNPHEPSGHERDTTMDDEKNYQWESGYADAYVPESECPL